MLIHLQHDNVFVDVFHPEHSMFRSLPPENGGGNRIVDLVEYSDTTCINYTYSTSNRSLLRRGVDQLKFGNCSIGIEFVPQVTHKQEKWYVLGPYRELTKDFSCTFHLLCCVMGAGIAYDSSQCSSSSIGPRSSEKNPTRSQSE